MKNKKITVIDFFCWAWWFSEGFRQQWFKIVRWIEYWKTAIDTHNLNHNLNDEVKNVLDFWADDNSNVEEIDKLENVEIIIWSPPCVSFSTSNKWWKANKSSWIQLIKSFLRVVAVKKHQKKSKLIAWYMENVPNSRNYVCEEYTFEMLNLWKWAESIWKLRTDIALRVKNNWEVLNSWDYWAPQSRKRFIAWEFCETGEFLSPEKTHEKHITLWEVLKLMPSPKLKKTTVTKKIFKDPNYPNLELRGLELTDHFYDTGLYKIEWEMAKYLKTYNYCMWKMSFPENLNKPCRTIMATQSARTRESLILKSEYNREWDWEFRSPTIREISTFMWFPLSYQFTWNQWNKRRQIWNAVSPHLSTALAKAIRKKLWLESINKINFLDLNNNNYEIINLNDFKEKKFDNPKKRIKNARFRRPILKKNNITVDLMNYSSDMRPWESWFVKVFFWTWKDFKQLDINKNHIEFLESYIKENFDDWEEFLWKFHKFKNKEIWLIDINILQNIYEEDLYILNKQNPINIRNKLHDFILKNADNDELISGIDFILKNEIPKTQILIIYCLWKIIFN